MWSLLAILAFFAVSAHTTAADIWTPEVSAKNKCQEIIGRNEATIQLLQNRIQQLQIERNRVQQNVVYPQINSMFHDFSRKIPELTQSISNATRILAQKYNAAQNELETSRRHYPNSVVESLQRDLQENFGEPLIALIQHDFAKLGMSFVDGIWVKFGDPDNSINICFTPTHITPALTIAFKKQFESGLNIVKVEYRWNPFKMQFVGAPKSEKPESIESVIQSNWASQDSVDALDFNYILGVDSEISEVQQQLQEVKSEMEYTECKDIIKKQSLSSKRFH
jgi:hypothetical protein